MNNLGNEHEMKIANNYVSFEQLQRRNWKPIEGVPCVIFAKVGAAIMLDRKRIVRVPFLIDNNTMAYIFDGSWDVDFGKTLFETIPLPRYAQVGALPSYNGSDIEDIEVCVPTNEEQTKIAELFVSLDNLITLHQRKLEKIKAMKAAYLTEMFPQEGENVPKRRFAGFTDAWEDRKLSDIADRFDNLRVPITASDRKPGDTPYYGANGIQDYVEGFTHNGEFILVAEDGANDLKNYPVQYVNGKVWVNNHAHVLQGKKTITDNKFLMNAIKNFNIEPFLVGGGRAKLNADVMMKLNILLPTFVEQEKIGSLFSLLDKTITLHQRKLDKLQNIKKAYLNEMFI